MRIRMGPVLGFRGISVDATGSRASISVLVVTDGGAPDALTASSGAGSGVTTGPWQPLLSSGRSTAFVATIEALLGDTEQVVTYTVGDRTHRFHVPAAGQSPRIAFASCNGFSDPKLMKCIADKNERWRHLATRHAGSPRHLLVLGGDQVYGDEIWTSRVPLCRAWSEKGRAERVRASFTPAMEKQVRSFYFDLYAERWAIPEVAEVLASVPTLMMWDDHDIFDGWGSYADDLQRCAVQQGIFGAARDAFLAFQQHAAPGSRAPAALPGATGHTWAHRVGKVALLGLDLRTDRTLGNVMSKASWDAVVAWLDALPARRAGNDDALAHLLVVSSIPVVYADFGQVDEGLGALPGTQELEDDLRDHWQSAAHRAERLRLVHRLLRVAREKAIRVTILSGDVHVAALGAIVSTRSDGGPERAGVVNQLIASGIVHPPPPATLVWAMKHLLEVSDEIDQGIRASLIAFPNAPRRERFLPVRNWLSLEPDEPGREPNFRLWAAWHGERLASPYEKVIHATSPLPAAEPSP